MIRGSMEVSGLAITPLPTNENLITDNLIINIASLSAPVKGKSSLDKLAFWLYIQNIVIKHCFGLRGDTMAKQIEGVDVYKRQSIFFHRTAPSFELSMWERSWALPSPASAEPCPF